ncbi:hypothetical protein NQZ68_010350 [Dissostichus eleginoides]|nr:hypothetical protein NQZ68_010350 [Dissostichus eleginoides]
MHAYLRCVEEEEGRANYGMLLWEAEIEPKDLPVNLCRAVCARQYTGQRKRGKAASEDEENSMADALSTRTVRGREGRGRDSPVTQRGSRVGAV